MHIIEGTAGTSLSFDNMDHTTFLERNPLQIGRTLNIKFKYLSERLAKNQYFLNIYLQNKNMTRTQSEAKIKYLSLAKVCMSMSQYKKNLLVAAHLQMK